MAHALAAFINERMTQRGLRNRDLVTASGLSRALVSKYVTDTRETLNRLPAKETLDGLAKGLGVSPSYLLGRAIESLGLGYEAGDFVNSVATATDQELLDELGARVERRLAAPEQIDRGALAAATFALDQVGRLPDELRQLRNHLAHSAPEVLADYLASTEGAASVTHLLEVLTRTVRPLPDPEIDQVEAFLAGDDDELARLKATKAERERLEHERAAHEDETSIEEEQGHPEDA